jgi:hypothetical protein
MKKEGRKINSLIKNFLIRYKKMNTSLAETSTLLWQMEAVGCDKLLELPDKKEITVAVLDTGIDIEHQDLNIWTNPDEIPNNGIDDDNNGYIDDIHGWNFAKNKPGDFNISSTHGTKSAGIIGATGEHNTAVIGMNPGVEIMPLQIFGCDTVVWKAVEAVEYAVENGADVINNSWLTYGPFSMLEDALQEAYDAGVIVVGGVGNDSWDYIGYPARYDTVIGVTATSQKDTLVSNANYGMDVDFGSPTGFTSTAPGNKYGSLGATSAASASASGAISLLLQKLGDGYSSDKIFEALKNTVREVPDLQGKAEYPGVINVWEAYKYLTGESEPPTPTPTPTPTPAPAPAPENPDFQKLMIQGTLYKDLNKNNVYDACDKPIGGYLWNDVNNDDIRQKNEQKSTNLRGDFNVDVTNWSNIGACLWGAKSINSERSDNDYLISNINFVSDSSNGKSHPNSIVDFDLCSHQTFSCVSELDSGTVETYSFYNSPSISLELPFDIEYLGESSSHINIYEDGILSLGADNDIKHPHNNFSLDKGWTTDGIIAPFWDDIKSSVNSANSQDILYWNNGDKAIIQYNEMEHEGYAGFHKGKHYTFQVELSPDDIQFNYAEMEGIMDSATIGIKSFGNNGFLQANYNSDLSLDNSIIDFSLSGESGSAIGIAEMNIGGLL